MNQNKNYSSIKALCELNWLPIRVCIDFKILLIIHKCFSDSTSPSYLQNLLVHNKRSGMYSNCRSNGSNGHLLVIPYVRHKTFAIHSFSVYGHRLRNSIPTEIKAITSVENFKKAIKTHLFKKHVVDQLQIKYQLLMQCCNVNCSICIFLSIFTNNGFFMYSAVDTML